MAVFVRKNALVCSVAVKAADGSDTQPDTATAQLVYKDLECNVHTQDIELVFDSSTGKWSGLWDSSVAGNTTVKWVVYTGGSIEAAAQGEFRVIANSANTA